RLPIFQRTYDFIELIESFLECAHLNQAVKAGFVPPFAKPHSDGFLHFNACFSSIFYFVFQLDD
ncbi:hypothetical protein NPN18_26025, partial [Vibrio parahaemolyticus]|nr:hypothetical protein [Vibrio parahaemolyticus]